MKVGPLQCLLEECGWVEDKKRDVWEIAFSTRPWLPGAFVRKANIREKRTEILDAVTAALDLDPECGPWLKPLIERISLSGKGGGKSPPRKWNKT